MELIYTPFILFMIAPWAALVPAALFAAAGMWMAPGRWSRWAAYATAALWLLYALYEIGLNVFDLLGGEPIRVDLLVIAPALWIAMATAAATFLTGWTRKKT